MSGSWPDWRGDEPLGISGTRLLEASAGTGKTWQIAHLVTRLVAEAPGVPIERLLVITFTNAAAAELRDRVRRRLLAGREALRTAQSDDGAPFKDDWLLASLVEVEAPERAARLLRVEAALAGFDLAPISTIHAFAQRTLRELAFEAGQEADLELLQDIEPILARLVADGVVRARTLAKDAAGLEVLSDLGFTPARLERIVRVAAAAAAPRLRPEPGETDWFAALTAQMAYAATASGSAPPAAAARAALLPLLVGAPAAAALARDLATGAKKQHQAELCRWFDAGAAWEALLDRSGKPRAFARAYADRGSGALAAADDGVAARCQSLFAALASDRAAPLAAFARSAKLWLDQELLRRRALSFDAMLSRLAAQIERTGADGPLGAALSARYDVALVDEFQDTDAAQWAVLEAAFRRPHKRLVLIGDPKQAIYAFRGADVHVYQRAASGAGREPPARATMRSNYRSDPGLLAALNHLLGHGRRLFGAVDFDYVEVAPPEAYSGPDCRLIGVVAARGGDATSLRPRRALELRWLSARCLAHADSDAIEDDLDRPIPTMAEAHAIAAKLCVEEASSLLNDHYLLERDGQAPRPVGPSDLCVLVRTAAQGDAILDALRAAGIAAIGGVRSNVFESPAVDWLLAWLGALAAAGDGMAPRQLALTPLVGAAPEDLEDEQGPDSPVAAGGLWAASEAAPEPVSERLRAALVAGRVAYARSGVLAALDLLLESFSTVQRLLTYVRGERHATDLRHVAERLHVEQRRTRVAPAALAIWLRAERARPGSRSDTELSLRLESDAKAVRVSTIHAAKGLEFPVVLFPFGWAEGDRRGELLFHDEGGELWLDLHPPGSMAADTAAAQADREHAEEAVRLIYVALTRAAHHLVIWHGLAGRAAARDVVDSALGRALLPAGDGSPLQRLTAAAAHPHIGLRVEAPPQAVRRARNAPASAPNLVAAPAPFPRASLDDGWRLTSYTGTLRRLAAHEAPAVVDALRLRLGDDAEPADAVIERPSEGPPPGVQDRREAHDDRPSTPAHREGDALRTDAPLADLMRGASVGVWTHAVLEQLDFAGARSGQLASQQGEPALSLCQRMGMRLGVSAPDAASMLAAALPGILLTPLDTDGPLARLEAGFCLADLDVRDRRDELAFDLGLGRQSARDGGAGTAIDGAAIHAALALREACDASWDGGPWLRDLLARDAGQLLDGVHGVMTGFIDLVFRARCSDGRIRYFICDYKTNRLRHPGHGDASTRAAYTRAGMARSMAEHHYPLQALIYTVALHRLLRARLSTYSYEADIGGYLYLFVRAMEGPSTPRVGGCALGVYADRWPAEVVDALDAAFDGACAQPPGTSARTRRPA